uniref:SCP domain-containing protein n=1 Tax=Pristionchus pacificus TaxID=54126 RepID=A0A8R1V3Z0_PRIPA
MGNTSSLPTPQGYSDKEADDIRKKILTEHNRVRVLHNEAPISFEEKMNKSAQEAANSMARKEKLETANTVYGEILYSCSGTAVKAENVVSHFYNNSQRGATNPQLTQILSPNSRRLGVGISRSQRGTLYICLLYSGSGSLEPQADHRSNITLQYGNECVKENKPLQAKSLNENRAEILSDHNQYRAKHRAAPLRFDETLNKSAQAYAEKLAKEDKGLAHSDSARSGKHGENLYCASGHPPTDSSRAWYSEIANYNFVAGKFAPNTGHFTALVWKSSSSLGLGIAQSKSGKTFVVAQYSPPGNRAGQYVENVLPAQ